MKGSIPIDRLRPFCKRPFCGVSPREGELTAIDMLPAITNLSGASDYHSYTTIGKLMEIFGEDLQ
ncbi:hypothetical protein [Pseudobacteriovorax antillogorgiicola]|uniref:Uncharacterized protein n=1 Tax=Pseudobacteriovorax antillogorgiicola TaxID=1513793 RepID=A0A1Y6BXZ2_9BACT|nr:hypothetical protein [Pseudobacteriovorax antillogorgiicola]TCS43366.1 hypothetical protein EDD56_1376 [Pseudobacteriovorax antillogorgiicola]SMF35110.1 hypothetical protein SAMN06296036_110202 [Pseudobacteriovorax antillogorgiicola]